MNVPIAASPEAASANASAAGTNDQGTGAAPTAQAAPAYVRETTAPNGEPWPTKAGYIGGYEKSNVSGLSKVTVDNSQNDADVFVKLVSLASDTAYPARTFFIPAFGSFTVNKVDAGAYDVRYRDLDTGALARSESFTLEETEQEDGVQFSVLTMTLFKVKNGNMQTYPLAEAEF